ncbi:hypothetical protein Dip510_002024 [Elusimicrobium posterum]|uniref:hypothetical protein n=1 Tax=Elusimicrobium posterum TaxID=3116653 RepID=UPI003C720620
MSEQEITQQEEELSQECKTVLADVEAMLGAAHYEEGLNILREALAKEKDNIFKEDEIEYFKELCQDLSDMKFKRDEWGLKEGEVLPKCGAPILFTLNGIGSKLYGDTLYLVFLFIPVIPLSRYAVEDAGDNSYLFHGKLKLTTFKRVWKWVALISLFVLLFPILKAMVTGIGSAIISKF